EGVLRALTDFPRQALPHPRLKNRAPRGTRRPSRLAPSSAAVDMVAPQAFPFGGPLDTGARFEIFGSPEIEARAEVYSGIPADPRKCWDRSQIGYGRG